MLVVVTVLAFFFGGVTACADADAVTHQSGDESVQSVQHSRKMLWINFGGFTGNSGGGGDAGGAAAAAAAAAAANRRAAAASYYAAARRGGLTSGSG